MWNSATFYFNSFANYLSITWTKPEIEFWKHAMLKKCQIKITDHIASGNNPSTISLLVDLPCPWKYMLCYFGRCGSIILHRCLCKSWRQSKQIGCRKNAIFRTKILKQFSLFTHDNLSLSLSLSLSVVSSGTNPTFKVK